MTSFAPPLPERTILDEDGRLTVFRKIGIVLLVVMLAFAMTGPTPFTKGFSAEEVTDNLTNQLFWLGAFCVALYVILGDLPRTLAVLSRNWPTLLVLAWCVATIAWSDHPDVTLRRAAKLVIIYVVALAGVVACNRLDRLLAIMALVTGLVMFVNVATVPIPSLGRLPQGDFVGMHPGKNAAGQVALIAILVWLCYARTMVTAGGKLLAYGAVAVFYVFMLGTLSKTATALAVLVPVACWLLNYFGRATGFIRVSLYVCAAAVVLLLAALGGVLGITGEDVLGLFVSDLTFTGRDAIWRFTFDVGMLHPWGGLGYGGLWHVGDQATPLDWALDRYPEAYFIPFAGQAHNGYLDLFAQTGAIGLLLALIAIVRSLLLARHFRDDVLSGPVNRPAMDAIFAILLAFVVLNITESAYFKANHPTTAWLFVLLIQVDLEVARRAMRLRAARELASAPTTAAQALMRP
jgi:exopolysaccharide production protein ExoQ